VQSLHEIHPILLFASLFSGKTTQLIKGHYLKSVTKFMINSISPEIFTQIKGMHEQKAELLQIVYQNFPECDA